ncbi:hypothetical protein LguiB_033490 [Lonicera macranthoides]
MKKTKRSLPEDLVVNLLSRLPVKSICRFRCVCKEWLALISDSGPNSVKDLHNKQLRKVPSLIKWNMPLTYECPIRPEEVGLKKKKEIKGDSVSLLPYITRLSCSEVQRLHNKLDTLSDVDVASCQGLICFISWDANELHVCNPTTNELVKIPESPNSRKDSYPRGAKNNTGFGYLSSMDQYKIVRFYEVDKGHVYGHECEMGCEIFTLTDGGDVNHSSWEVIGKQDYLYLCKASVCVEGVIYWLLKSRDSMLAFDLEREEHKIIPLPDLEREQHENVPSPRRSVDGFRHLIDFGGSLCLVRFSRGKVSAWTLTDPKGPDWVPEYKLRFIPRSVEEIVYSSTTDEGVQIAVSSWNEMFWYDSKRETLTRCFRKTGKSEIEKEDYPCAYVESLFSLRGA